jgi:RecA/RadA recombinase
MPRRETTELPAMGISSSISAFARSRAAIIHEPAPTLKPLYAACDADDCIPTGCTVLNLALSGRADGGWLKGRIANVVGDSDTGKTVLVLTTLAEVANGDRCKRHELHYDDVEQSNGFDMASMFGYLSDRLDDADASFFVEDFYGKVFKLLRRDKSFIYVCDSMDALVSHASIDKFEENIKLLDNGKEAKGSYGDGKAKFNSEGLRTIKPELKKKDSLLLIVSQTRDNINPMSMEEKTRAGGRALKFYSCYEMWLAKRMDMSATQGGVKRKLGVVARVRISKNHATGKHLDFNMPIYYGYGIDDERCCIMWLIAEGIWKGKEFGGDVITNGEFGPKEWKCSALAQAIRAHVPHRSRLSALMQESWDAIEQKCRRPGRYSGGVAEESE